MNRLTRLGNESFRPAGRLNSYLIIRLENSSAKGDLQFSFVLLRPLLSLGVLGFHRLGRSLPEGRLYFYLTF